MAQILDDFRDLSCWSAIGSGLAELVISPDRGESGAAMRLDFDFKGGGGFVIARRALTLPLPERYEISFRIRGSAPRNKLELKLSDASGRNVWWYRRDALEVTEQGDTLRIPSSEIEFAWGPAGGGTLAELGFVELAIVAGPGGRGRIWIEDLRIEDRTYRGAPRISASSSDQGHGPQHVLDAAPAHGWRSAPGSSAQWLHVDFQDEREYGGLRVHWEAGRRARAFEVHTSDDGQAWQSRGSVRDADAATSDLYMPATRARHLQLRMLESEREQGFGIERIEVRPFEFSRSLTAFFHALAQDALPGSYPRYLSDEQSYWSPVALPEGAPSALLNEEGMVELDKGGASIEPLLWDGARLITWADAEISLSLTDGYLPIPCSEWRASGLSLTTTAYAGRIEGEPVLFIRYAVSNGPERARRVLLFAAIRPFQVTPPWQAHQGLGGPHAIRSLQQHGGAVVIDEAKSVFAPGQPYRFGAAAFAQGNVVDALRRGGVPERTRVTDDFGYASGALEFALELGVGGSATIELAIPFSRDPAAVERLAAALAERAAGPWEAVHAAWRAKLAALAFQLPGAAQAFAASAKTALAHILINRDKAALQPGPRRYTRSWIRDGATMAAALLRAGCNDEACAFIEWYAPFQAADGNVPCCVDERGPDWLVEHDSHGELIFCVMECYRFTRDRGFLQRLWPAVQRAVDYLERLRATRLTDEYAKPELRARRGLLPESASHEGYLAHPVHSYWDDAWALRGLRDAAAIAEVLADEDQVRRIGALRDAFRGTLRASLEETIRTRGLDFLPGSVEWADFDPTATANLALLDELHDQPEAALHRTFDRYMEMFRSRRTATDWNNYTAYEIRIVTALVAIGRRADAAEVAQFLLDDRRPVVWNQWPEISWRLPQTPGHIGDVPHSWIGAEYVIAVRSMLLYEVEHARSVVIGAGIPQAWLKDGPVTAYNLPTYYGRLSLRLAQTAVHAIEVTLSGTLDDGVQLKVRPPLPGPLRQVKVNGQAVAHDADGVTVSALPATVVLECRTS